MKRLKKPTKLFEMNSTLGTIVCEAKPCIAVSMTGESWDSVNIEYYISMGCCDQVAYAPEATDYRGNKRKNVNVAHLFMTPDFDSIKDAKLYINILKGSVQRVLIDNNWLKVDTQS